MFRSKPDLIYIEVKKTGYESIFVPLGAILEGSQSILRCAWSCLIRLPVVRQFSDGYLGSLLVQEVDT